MLYYVNGLILRRLLLFGDYLLLKDVQSDLKKTAEIFVKIFQNKNQRKHIKKVNNAHINLFLLFTLFRAFGF